MLPKCFGEHLFQDSENFAQNARKIERTFSNSTQEMWCFGVTAPQHSRKCTSLPAFLHKKCPTFSYQSTQAIRSWRMATHACYSLCVGHSKMILGLDSWGSFSVPHRTTLKNMDGNHCWIGLGDILYPGYGLFMLICQPDCMSSQSHVSLCCCIAWIPLIIHDCTWAFVNIPWEWTYEYPHKYVHRVR